MEKHLLTKQSFEEVVKDRTKGRMVTVVFQGEPFQHTKTARDIIAKPYVGGVTAALEPVMQATDGLWVAWGRGDADRLVVDENDHVRMPPHDPKYTLRRLWLYKNDVDHWYYGFANSAIWPLAHIAHVQPEFRQDDWEVYKKVNQTFARITDEETNGKNAIIWVHDYQLALVPQYLRERKNGATIGFFWHIPWPLREVFRICPWRKEILEGLLGSDIIGFHVPTYATAFLATVAQELEAKVDYDAGTIEYKGHLTRIKAYPISIDYEQVERLAIRGEDHGRDLLKHMVTTPHRFLAFSADRLDYTKGILERLRAVDRFLEKYPHYRGQFTYLMIQSPSRTRVPAYQNLRRDVLDVAERINFKYAADVWQPIFLLERTLDPYDLYSLYRVADLAVVSAIHDGMNLVAKEYIAAAQPTGGRLILSEFAGAAKELTDAILINPYDAEEFSDALKVAIEMPLKERTARMKVLKDQVREHNIYVWANNILTDLANLPSRPRPRKR